MMSWSYFASAVVVALSARVCADNAVGTPAYFHPTVCQYQESSDQFVVNLWRLPPLKSIKSYNGIDWLRAFLLAWDLQCIEPEEAERALRVVGVDILGSSDPVGHAWKVRLVLQLAFDHGAMDSDAGGETDDERPFVWKDGVLHAINVPSGASGPLYDPAADYRVLRRRSVSRRIEVPHVLLGDGFQRLLSALELPSCTDSVFDEYVTVARALRHLGPTRGLSMLRQCFSTCACTLEDKKKVYVLWQLVRETPNRITKPLSIDYLLRQAHHSVEYARNHHPPSWALYDPVASFVDVWKDIGKH
jgi:hypothetical protein